MQYHEPSDPRYRATPPLAALAAVMFLGYLIGLIQEGSNGYDFNGEHWQKDYYFSFGIGCGFFEELAVENGIREYSPIDSYREPNTNYSGLIENNVNTIYCSDVEPPASLNSTSGMQSDEQFLTDEAGAVVGKAKWWWQTGTTEISECDIWLSTKAGIIEIRAVATHELGHCWGMQHSSVKSALMAPVVGSFTPTLDDMAGLSDLYGDCATVQIDKNGKTFFPAIDPKTILSTIKDPEFKEYEGVIISGYIDANAVFPAGIYDIGISKCGQ